MKSLKAKGKKIRRTKIKRITVVSLMVLSLTIGTGVSAASETSTVSEKMNEFMTSIVNGLIPDIEKYATEKTEEMKNAIRVSTEKLLSEARDGLQSFGESEKERIDRELNEYKEMKVEQVRADIGNHSGKNRIQSTANTAIESGKQAIDEEVNRILAEKQ
ncbi:hypothetical protein M3182_24965 [Mesobacillus maritimus]|uniref:hypothetical protein n=1 Tax=Mesobacillus maritimus TaxID=1643336 RepID=UPI00203E5748|nr:hypothetical protein [Mesobacillus maritimus]MCM3588880.1 hypothetical protein [Mesobacillus maritimus]